MDDLKLTVKTKEELLKQMQAVRTVGHDIHTECELSKLYAREEN
jgi:hypothetical protein